MPLAREELLDALRSAMVEVCPANALEAMFETPRQAAHGDLAVTAAMALAKLQRKNPREVAAALVVSLKAQRAVERWVESIDVVGPGFINLTLRPAARQRIVADVLASGTAFGFRKAAGEPVIVEFVSANPTGPLHVGHARQAALGDAICNLLETQGRRVVREFYYNDAGVQIATLAASVKARLDGLKPGDAGWPEAAYNGDYIADIAADFAAKKTVAADDRSHSASGDASDLDAIRQFAVAYLRHEQDLDLAAFGVRFDDYFLESSLYASGRVEQTVAALIASGKTFEEGGALWLRTTEFGDDKDRVMRKSDGTYTYFNIQGTDHHGTIARVRAGLQATEPSIPKGYPDYVLNTMVRVERGGVEVKLSKRAGQYVTLRDLIDWTSRDAVRFFMLSRKADTEFTFDVDLALKQNDENPVFYVQYAHARICSVIEQFKARLGEAASEGLSGADLARLEAPSETVLMKKLAAYPEVLAAAASTLSPHEIAFYLRDLAAAFHSFYAAERVIIDDLVLARARLALLAATRQVIANALGVLGVSAPARMNRETETA